MNSRFVQPAEDEVAEAVDHYQVTHGLGQRFLGEVQRAVTTIEQFPRTSPVIASEIRRKVLLEFPYSLFYRLTRTRSSFSRLHITGSDHCTGGEDCMRRMPADSNGSIRKQG